MSEIVTRAGAADKSGWLKKQGGRFTSYKKRWFELRGAFLYYFRTQKDQKPAGMIPLVGCSCAPEDQSKNKGGFTISGPFPRVYHVLAEGDEKMEDWMESIKNAARDAADDPAARAAVVMDDDDDKDVPTNATPVPLGNGSSGTSASGKKIGIEDFELMRVIGRGSFGKVMQVRKKDDGKVYAMKVLKKDVIVRENMVGHTKMEKSILQQVQHPFIVNLRYAFQTSDKLYLILDYLSGGELFFHLKKDGRFSEDRARLYTAEIALAIEHLHKNNIIYRDLKPENIVLDEAGHIALTDFGLAKVALNHQTPTYTFCGTPEYLAPEILTGAGHNKAVDWWSLGVLLYEMLTGLPPFYSENINEMYELILRAPLRFPDYVSPSARSLLKGLLDRDPAKRTGSGPADGEELRQHPFFASMNWELLMAKKIPAPFVPSKSAAEKAQYFDTEFTSERAHDSVVESREIRSENVDFEDFTYNGDQTLANVKESKDI
jgi:serine/threonine protein kinase